MCVSSPSHSPAGNGPAQLGKALASPVPAALEQTEPHQLYHCTGGSVLPSPRLLRICVLPRRLHCTKNLIYIGKNNFLASCCLGRDMGPHLAIKGSRPSNWHRSPVKNNQVWHPCEGCVHHNVQPQPCHGPENRLSPAHWSVTPSASLEQPPPQAH